MSNVIDERIVEMRFDNKDFESNAKESMSTLEKLKKSLNLSGAAKGMESVGKAAKQLNFNPISSGVQAVQSKFSALEVVATGALLEIGRQIENTGRQLVSSFTIDPIKSGFEEYETQINAVQTILANTSSSGTTLDQVNSALDELNHYADKTIYNFTEMTKNIGTFTAAGVDLDTSVSAIQGIANLAAVSGSTSQQASTAMYQLSQALATGTVKLMDWNSVVNAGMGGEVFQNALKETARLHGVAIDSMIEEEGSFRETLQKGWLTSEILTETLSNFTTSGANEYLAEHTNLTADDIQALRDQATQTSDVSGQYKKMAKTLAESSDLTEDQIYQFLNMSTTAEDAATKVKTFTQLMDTLKEAAQSGWTQTWELVIGDFEQAKELYTGLSDFFSNLINNSADRRNSILESALKSPYEKFISTINEAGLSTEDLQTRLSTVLKNHGSDLDSVIEKYGSLEDAIKQGGVSASYLKEALNGVKQFTLDIDGLFKNGSTGDEVKQIQEALTSLGYDIGDAGADGIFGSATEEAIKAFQEAKGLTADGIVDADTIAALNEAANSTDYLTNEINDLIGNLDQLGGRELMLESFKNVWVAIRRVLNSIKGAWNTVFPPKSIEERSEQLYDLIQKFHDFTETLKPNAKQLLQIRQLFAGIFSVVKLVANAINQVATAAFKGLKSVLGGLDIDILGIGASIGKTLSNFASWAEENEIVAKGINKITSFINTAIPTIKRWFDEFMQLPVVQKYIGKIQSVFAKYSESIGEYFSGGIRHITNFINHVKEMGEITLSDFPKIFKEFKDNVLDYFFNFDIDDITAGLKSGIEKLKTWLSTNLEALKTIIVDKVKGLVSGAKEGAEGVGTVFDDIREKLMSFVELIKTGFSGIDWGKVLAFGSGVGIIVLAKKLKDIYDSFNLLDDISDLMQSFAKKNNAEAWKTKSEGIRNIALSIAIVVGAVYVLTKIDPDRLNQCVEILVVLAGGLLGMAFVTSKLDGAGKKLEGSAKIFLSMAAALLILSLAVEKLTKLNDLNSANTWQSIGQLAVMLAALCAAIIVVSKLAPQMSKGSIMMIAMAYSLKVIVDVVKEIYALQLDDIRNHSDAFIAVFGSLGAMALAARIAGKNAAKAGVGVLLMSAAIKIIISCIKELAAMDSATIERGTDAVSQIMIMFAIVTGASLLAGKNASKAGSMMLKMSVALLIITGVIAILGNMDSAKIQRAIDDLEQIGLFFAALMAVSILARGKLSTIAALAVAIGAITLALAGLSMISDTSSLNTAVDALSSVMTRFVLVIAATKRIPAKSTGSILAMAAVVAAIGVILYELATIDNPQNALVAALALSGVMVALSASMKIISKGSSFSKGTYASIVMMGLIVAGLAYVLYKLNDLNPENSLAIATSLSELLIALSSATLMINKAGSLGLKSSLVGIASMGVAIAGIGGIMAACTAINNQWPELKNFLSEGLPLLQSIGSGIGTFVGSILGSGAEALGTGLGTGLTEVSNGLTSFCTAIEPFFGSSGSFSGDSLSGLKSMTEALIALTEASFLDALTKLVGSFTGESSLATFGQELASFAPGFAVFANLMRLVPTDIVEKASGAAESVAAFARKIPNEGGLLADLIGDNTLERFGEELVAFAPKYVVFANAMRAVPADIVEKASGAAESVAAFANKIGNQGGLLADLIGDNTLGQFGQEMVKFAPGYVVFANLMRLVPTGIVENAANAAESVAAFANKIGNQGGLLASLVGDNTLGQFGKEMASFAPDYVVFANLMRLIPGDIVEKSMNVADSIIAFSKEIPNSGGLLGMIMGNNDMDSFGNKLAAFGRQFVNYSNTLKGEGGAGLDGDLVLESAKIAWRFASIASGLSDDSYWDGLVSYGYALSAFGEDYSEFYGYIAETDYSKIAGIASAVQSLKSVMDILNGYTEEIDTTTFVNNLGDIQSFLANDLVPTFADIDLTEAGAAFMSSFIEGMKTQSESLSTTISEMLTTAMSSATSDTSLSTAGGGLVSNLMSGISGSSTGASPLSGLINSMLGELTKSYSTFNSAGKLIVQCIRAGINSNVSSLTSAFSGTLSSMVASINGYYNSFYSAGAYVVMGFARGITANTFAARAAATVMAQAALNAATSTLHEASPSKAFYKIGDFAGQGFVNALSDSIPTVYNTSSDMASAALEGTKRTLSAMSSVFTSDMDVDPTIAPVLDLSNVRSGVNDINSMLNLQRSIGVSPNIDAISHQMAQRQNAASNADVVSAINGLQKKLGNARTNNTWNINGITYDDGSNIANAVGTLARALRIEGRA